MESVTVHAHAESVSDGKQPFKSVPLLPSERGCEKMFPVSGVCGQDLQKDAFNVKSVSKLCKMKFALSGVCRLRKDVVNGYSV